MAFISLEQMYNTWKRVADWVSGTSADVPKVQVMNIPTEYVGYSTQPKPTTAKKNDTFLELDTKKVFIHDGTSFVEF